MAMLFSEYAKEAVDIGQLASGELVIHGQLERCQCSINRVDTLYGCIFVNFDQALARAGHGIGHGKI